MEISYPTLNRILNSPIEEVVKELVEGKIMDITGDVLYAHQKEV